MKLLLSVFISIFSFINSFAQIENLITKFNLPNVLEESSGLLFYNNKLITHNDSGNAPNLYELDTITGQIVRTIQILNATNQDWEDIAQDDDYIYVGDFGNNNGNRTNLKIYRIDKLDYLMSNAINAEIINFYYEDQTDFSNNPQTNFDAEAMVILNDEILIFTKNRGDFKTKAYKFLKSIGTHSATKTGTYDSQGLITGATINYLDYSIFLTGYNFGNDIEPFLIYLSNFSDDAIFDGNIQKTDITSIIGEGSQLEAITNLGNERYFLSRENSGGLMQRVFAFSSAYVLDIDDFFQTEIIVYPNPFKDCIKINSTKTIQKIEVFNLNGKKLFTKTNHFDQINILQLKTGKYIFKVYIDNKPIVKKLFKF